MKASTDFEKKYYINSGKICFLFSFIREKLFFLVPSFEKQNIPMSICCLSFYLALKYYSISLWCTI